LRLVAPDRALHELGRASFRTQQGRILDSGARAPEERIPGISVIQAADVEAISGDVVDSDRRAIYDGVITYGDDLVIVIESKLDGWVSDRQAREINRHEANIEFDPRPRPISWREVLDALSDLVDGDRSLVGGAEKALIEDFLEFCQRHFPALLPFSSLRRCAGDPQRIIRRLAAIISTIALDPQDADGHKLMLPGRASVERVYLDVDASDTDPAGRVSVWMFPADTLGQARAVWPHPEKVRALQDLTGTGWDISPNMHFTYLGTGLVDTRGSLTTQEYMAYWQEHIGETGALKPDKWNEYWQHLVAAGIADPGDRGNFDAKFTDTKNRHNAVPCPGLVCGKGWTRSAAEHADDEGRLDETVRDTINEMLRALGEPEITPP
jgi:hypothetical protein